MQKSCFVLLFTLPLLALVPSRADESRACTPRPMLPLGRDTSRVTGPLDRHRYKALDRIESDLSARRKQADGKLTGTQLGDEMVELLSPRARRVQEVRDRAEQAESNLSVAFALASYRAAHNCYPHALGDIAPDHLAVVPVDLFSGASLVYKPAGNGYLLYSVGPNGKDDGGRWYDDAPPGDDPRVRMPPPGVKVP